MEQNNTKDKNNDNHTCAIILNLSHTFLDDDSFWSIYRLLYKDQSHDIKKRMQYLFRVKSCDLLDQRMEYKSIRKTSLTRSLQTSIDFSEVLKDISEGLLKDVNPERYPLHKYIKTLMVNKYVLNHDLFKKCNKKELIRGDFSHFVHNILICSTYRIPFYHKPKFIKTYPNVAALIY